MKIKGWEKISGWTYKGYSIVNPIHNASEEIYYATIININTPTMPKWDIQLIATAVKGVITFSIRDNVTQELLAKSHLTKTNIDTLQKFIAEYELLIEDILEKAIASKVTKNINGGTTGILNTIQNAGTAVTYSIASQNGISMLPKSGSISIPLTNMQRASLQALKDLQEQIDKLNLK
jgi:hypothetical protein